MTRAPHVVARIGLSSGLKLSPVCLGWVARPSLIHDAFAVGINFFFVTADMHWPRYEASRRGLELLLRRVPRDQVVIAAASYVTQPEFCYAPFRELIEAVRGLGTIDITVMGGVYSSDLAQRTQQYRLHRAEGPQNVPGVRALGGTFHDRTAALLAANHRLVDLAYLRYNPLHPGAEQDVFPYLQRRSAVIFNFNCTRGYIDDAKWHALGLGTRRWRPKRKDYYRFALRLSRISGLLVSARTRQDIQDIASATQAPKLHEDEAAYMVSLADLAAGRTQLNETES